MLREAQIRLLIICKNAIRVIFQQLITGGQIPLIEISGQSQLLSRLAISQIRALRSVSQIFWNLALPGSLRRLLIRAVHRLGLVFLDQLCQQTLVLFSWWALGLAQFLRPFAGQFVDVLVRRILRRLFVIVLMLCDLFNPAFLLRQLLQFMLRVLWDNILLLFALFLPWLLVAGYRIRSLFFTTDLSLPCFLFHGVYQGDSIILFLSLLP